MQNLETSKLAKELEGVILKVPIEEPRYAGDTFDYVKIGKRRKYQSRWTDFMWAKLTSDSLERYVGPIATYAGYGRVTNMLWGDCIAEIAERDMVAGWCEDNEEHERDIASDAEETEDHDQEGRYEDGGEGDGDGDGHGDGEKEESEGEGLRQGEGKRKKRKLTKPEQRKCDINKKLMEARNARATAQKEQARKRKEGSMGIVAAASIPAPPAKVFQSPPNKCNQRMTASQRTKLYQNKTKHAWLEWDSNAGKYSCRHCCVTLGGRQAVTPAKFDQHAKGPKHMRAVQLQQFSVSQWSSTKASSEDFNARSSLHIASLAMPIPQAESCFSKEFIAAVASHPSLQSPKWLREHHLPTAFSQSRERLIAHYLDGKPYSLVIDEAPHKGKKYLGVLARTSEETILLDYDEFEETLDAENMCLHVDSLLDELDVQRSNMVSMTRDNAAYMVLTGQILAEDDQFAKPQTLACLSHGLNLCAQTLSEEFIEVEAYLSCLRRYLVGGGDKSFRQARANDCVPGFVNAINVSGTRWRDQLDCDQFVVDNFVAVMEFCRSELNIYGITGTGAAILNDAIALSDHSNVLMNLQTLNIFEPLLLSLIVSSQAENLDAEAHVVVEQLLGFRAFLESWNDLTVNACKERLYGILVEDEGVISLDEADVVLSGIARQLRNGIRKCVLKWDKYVNPSVPILEQQTWLNPESLRQRVINHGDLNLSIFPRPLVKHLKGSVGSNEAALFVEWSRYYKLCTVEGEDEAVDFFAGTKDPDGNSRRWGPGKWWATQVLAMPTLAKIAARLYSMTVTAAGVERSHKTLAKVVPSDGSRPTLSADNVKFETFAVYNRKLLCIWGKDSILTKPQAK
jgi:hypothetical protein